MDDPIHHIDSSESLGTIKPLCGEYRKGDYFALMLRGGQVPNRITCDKCLAVARFYALGHTLNFSRKEARREMAGLLT